MYKIYNYTTNNFDQKAPQASLIWNIWGRTLLLLEFGNFSHYPAQCGVEWGVVKPNKSGDGG